MSEVPLYGCVARSESVDEGHSGFGVLGLEVGVQGLGSRGGGLAGKELRSYA